MDVKISLKNIINDLVSTLDNDFVMQNIVSELVKKINKSKIIKADNKKIINQYFGNKVTPIEPAKLSNLGNTTQNLLLQTTIYFLSNLNNYDYHLINTAFDIGLQADNIIVLLLLNNIYDVEMFCRKHNIYGENFYILSTLKKLSAVHKIQTNF